MRLDSYSADGNRFCFGRKCIIVIAEKGKPAPDIFLLACEKVQILPERCLVLEDSVPGAKAAKAAGIPYIIVPDINYPEKEVAKAAEMVADSLLDVEKLFAL